MHSILTALLTAALVVPPLAAQQKPSRRPPVRVDFDMGHIPEPKPRSNSQFYDFFDATFFQQAKQAFDLPRYVSPKPAANVNSADEVPDSSWFTNRNGARRMTVDEIRRGPNTDDGPELQGPWTVTRKTSGITPGFRIRDAQGTAYIIKFDPPDYQELTSGAEVVATKLYHASGYNVPENHIVRFRPDMLQVAPDATFIDESGATRRMTSADLERILAPVPRAADGTMRALASKFLAGKPKGPFRYYGLRKDDANDWIPHEHRRDLRGLRIVAGWLNDNDIREQNTLDMYVTEDGRSFLRHHLIDFGSSLGSETLFPNTDRIGFEYILDGAEVMKSLFAFGAYQRPWTGRAHVEHKSIGFIESERFDPAGWKANYPIIAFENLTVADGYWGAKVVMSFTDEQIRAAVSAGQYSDPTAAEYLARTLIERRNKIGRYWFLRAGGLDDFEVSGAGGQAELRFRDRAVEHGFATASSRTYRFRVRRQGRTTAWQQLAAGGVLAVRLDANVPGDRLIELQVRDATSGSWSPTVSIHVGESGGNFSLLGWVRAVR